MGGGRADGRARVAISWMEDSTMLLLRLLGVAALPAAMMTGEQGLR